MIGTANKLATGLILAFTAGLTLPQTVLAQGGGFTLDTPRFTLPMSMGWDSVNVPEGQDEDFNVIAKLAGFGGLAYVSCDVGTLAPGLDAMALQFSGELGGNITKGRDSSLTLGKYQVKWQEFKYDSLPILSGMIQARSEFIPRIGKDSLRVYYLVSGGYVFTIAGVRVIAGTTAPYKDIEAGIAKLVLKPISGAVRFASRSMAGGLLVSDGMLGGDWLKAHPALSVECFALDGASFGAARSIGNGEWVLPAGKHAMVIQVHSKDGLSQRILAKP